MARILIVEDNPMARHALRRILEKADYEVTAVSDGPEGLAEAQERKPDAIILDMDLPTLDGWEVARALKEESATSDIPILALTSHALEGDRERALAAGCDEYATKPVQVPNLMARIAALLEASSTHAG